MTRRKVFQMNTAMMDEMTGEKRAELEAILSRMRSTAGAYYTSAVGIGVHRFLEFAGLLNEYIKVCQEMVDNGQDFVTEPLMLRRHNRMYIEEKLECILGGAAHLP